jgi:hypothetical protein
MELMKEFFTISEQARLFLFSCLLGLPVGIVFDVFRIFRKIFPHKKFVIHIEDVLFIFIWAILIVLYYTSFGLGQFRGIYVLGSGLGFVIYWCLSPLHAFNFKKRT